MASSILGMSARHGRPRLARLRPTSGPEAAARPSFDRAGAQGPVETAICRSENRSRLDVRLDRIAGLVRVFEVGPPGTETAADGHALAQTPKCGRRGRVDGICFPTTNRLRSN